MWENRKYLYFKLYSFFLGGPGQPELPCGVKDEAVRPALVDIAGGRGHQDEASQQKDTLKHQRKCVPCQRCCHVQALAITFLMFRAMILLLLHLLLTFLLPFLPPMGLVRWLTCSGYLSCHHRDATTPNSATHCHCPIAASAPTTAQSIYIKQRACLFVCLYVHYARLNRQGNHNETLHTFI